MAQYIVKALKTYLKVPLTTTATSVVLRKLQDSKENNLTLANFGAWGVIVIKQGDTIEMIKFSAISTAVDGTATLTVASSGRNLNPTTPYAGSSTGNAFSSGAEVIVTNDPLTVSQFGNLNNAQTWAALQTFTLAPISSADASAANELVRKSQLDAAVIGTLTLTPIVVPATGGAVLTVDQFVYLDVADGEWKPADADTAAQVENSMLGITRGAGTDGGAIAGGVTVGGTHEAASAIFTANTKYYASNTAGGFSTTPGTKEVSIGYAHTTTKFYLKPRFDQQITENQQDLIEKLEAGTAWYAASAVGTDSYAITITPAITAYVTGMHFRFLADVANTGAATLAVSGLSALAIKKLNDADLATGDIEAGQIVEVVYDGTDFQMQSQAAVAPATVDIQTFTSSGTWTKPSGALTVEVYMWGAGGGGGSGRREADGTTAGGGGGGGGGSFAHKAFLAAGLGATETVTIGAGGAGGATVTGSDNDGNAGSTGGATSFGTATLLAAQPGLGGAGGTVSTSVGGEGGAADKNGDLLEAGGMGGTGTAADAGGAAGTDTAALRSARGGGAGGGLNSAGTVKAPGVGGGFITNFVAAGGAVGTIGNSNSSKLYGGTGGGGGAANGSAGAGTIGGAGINGSGGGGGGASETTSGAGAAGGNGLIIVITYM